MRLDVFHGDSICFLVYGLKEIVMFVRWIGLLDKWSFLRVSGSNLISAIMI